MSDRRSHYGKSIVSDRRSQKMWSDLALTYIYNDILETLDSSLLEHKSRTWFRRKPFLLFYILQRCKNRTIYTTCKFAKEIIACKEQHHHKLLLYRPSKNDVTHIGGGGFAKVWCHAISLFSKMGDKGEEGIENLKKWVTSFMVGSLYSSQMDWIKIYGTIYLKCIVLSE